MTVQDVGGIGLILGDQGTAESGTVNLNGGTLAANLIRAFNGANTFYFNGGTLRPVGANANFFPTARVKHASAQWRRGGGHRGLNVSIGESLEHSAVTGDAAIDGGLTKISNGTLTLSGGYS